MKIIFLDIDGVLINRESCRKGFGVVDPDCVKALNTLVEKTGAYIVLSSTWRMGLSSRIEVADLLSNWGVKATALDRTGGHEECRGFEIGKWLQLYDRDDIESYVIIDDDADMGALLPRLVKTNFAEGFREEHIEKAIEILNRPAGVITWGDNCVVVKGEQ